jgi:gamma-glutamyltranspeptidase/glutathione hydrolase
VADPKAIALSTAQLLDPQYLARRAALIDMQRAQSFGPGNPAQGGTVYLTTADESGMMVSFIQSNYMGFGSGCVEPQFGISLQTGGMALARRPTQPTAPTW